jgi:hypothetical protein
MTVFKKPSELQPKLCITALIYGQPGVGKSTLACSAPGAVLFDYDGGATRINGAHQVPTLQVHSWEDTQAALNECMTDPTIQTIVVDTAGKMLSYIEDYIKRTQPKMVKSGGLTIAGYGVRKQMFNEFIQTALRTKRHLIFVAHESEQKQGDETYIRPEIGGSSANDLFKDLDLAGYMRMEGNKRTITFDPRDKYYAKNSCDGMEGLITLPTTVDVHGRELQANDFMTQVIAAYQRRQLKNIEENKQYEELCELIRDTINNVACAKDANEVIEWVQTLQHIRNSKAKAAVLLQAKCQSLGLKFDKESKVYADS